MDSRRLRLKSLPVSVAPNAAYIPQVTWCAGEPPPNWFIFAFGLEHLMYCYHLEAVPPTERPRKYVKCSFGQSRKSDEMGEWFMSDSLASFS